jgi:hypothetical protein
METEIHFVEEPVAGPADRGREVWLECDGEPCDFRAVDVLGTRYSVHDVEVVSSSARTPPSRDMGIAVPPSTTLS